MKVTIERKALKDAVDKAAVAVPTRSTLPQLENIAFSANGKLQLQATDLENSIIVTIANKAEREGSAMLPAKQMQDALARGTSDAVTLEVDELRDLEERFVIGKLIGAHSAMRFSVDKNIIPIPIDHQIPNPIGQFVMTGEMLRAIVAKAVPFVSTDELRASMMGVLFSYRGKDILSVYATDGHRLIRMRMPFFAGLEEWDIIVPGNSLTKAARVMGDTFNVDFNAEHILFTAGEVSFKARLIDERFPNVEAVIPRDNEKALFASKHAMRKALDSILVWANRNTAQVILQFERDRMDVRAENFETGAEANELVACDYASDPLRIGFNGRFLRDALGALHSDTVTAKFSTAVRAAIFEDSAPDAEVLILVMPVRIDGTERDFEAGMERRRADAKAQAEREAEELAAAAVEAAAEQAEADDDEDPEYEHHAAEAEADGDDVDEEHSEDTDADDIIGA